MEETISQSEGKKNTVMAVVAYILFFVPLLAEDSKNDSFVRYHVKQGLGFFLACVAAIFIMMVPVIGWIAILPMYVFLIICWITGILNALKGKEKPLPLIGKYAEKISI